MKKEATRDCKKCSGIEEDTVHLILDCNNQSLLILDEIDIAINKLTLKGNAMSTGKLLYSMLNPSLLNTVFTNKLSHSYN